ncbi:MAG TPA: hypothetical protein VMI75_20070 [Polyangiaceae bacterium]|nr:hypothetical protein [Polyangiaceae bacterium]
MSSRDLQVDAEPPRIVFESPAPCRDADRAEKLLHDALSSSRAPGAGWLVTMRVERDAQKHLKATARIDDGSGASVADRSLDGEGPECAGLAKAVGVWAGLVLDSRVQAAASLEQPPPAAPASPVPAAPETQAPPATAVASTTPAEGWPAPAQPDLKTPEHDWYLHHDAGQGRTFELGAGTFIMTGTGGGALAGPTIFAVIEAGGGLFLRPALAFGASLTSLPPSDVKSSMWGAARMDACLRLPGLYTRHKGMQLDLCGGTDVGVTSLTVDSGTTTLPYWDLGPSIDLRGELASNFSAVLRMVAGIEVLREQFQDSNGFTETVPLVGGRLELALSWDVR